MSFKVPTDDAPYRTFALNLQAKLYQRGWDAGRLASELKEASGARYGTKRLYNWIEGRHLPAKTIDVIWLAKVLNVDLSELLDIEKLSLSDAAAAAADYEENAVTNIIEDDVSYTKEREKTILNTQRTLWVQLRVAPPITESLYHIKTLVKRDIKIKLLISDLNDPGTMAMILRRNYDWAPDEVSAIENMKSALKMLLQGVHSRRGRDDLLKIRTIPYFPSTALYISDPYTEYGKLFAITTFFDVEPYRAPVVLANGIGQRRVFDSYSRQFWLMWRRGDDFNMEEYFKEGREKKFILLPKNFSRDR